MRKPFNGSFSLTQGWGLNPDIYKQFGLKGHNGTDWGLPTGTEVIAPHEGKVLEVAFDPTGYGNYIKIESASEGSILAHLQKSLVKVGDTVSEGQVVGISNNTGFSTGSHLHWGYYRIPRNRNDGYAGYIDPFPYIKAVSPKGSVTLPSEQFEALIAKLDAQEEKLKEFDRIEKLLHENERVNKEKDAIIKEVREKLDQSEKSNITLNSKIVDLTEAIAKDAIDDRDTLVELKKTQEELSDAKRTLDLIAFELAINPSYTSGDEYILIIEKLKKPNDEVVKEYLTLAKAFEQSAIYKRIPKKTLPIITRILNWFN